MKQILRLLAVVGFVLLAALISAGSCGKKDPATGNNNSGSGNASPFTFSSLEASLVKVSGDNILLKASGFPSLPAANAGEHFTAVNGDTATTRKKAFEVSYGTVGGMLFVVDGDKTSAAAVTVPRGTNALATDDKMNKGLHGVSSSSANGTLGIGFNYFSVFADKTAPADAAATAADKAPFAFTASTGAVDTQPIFWCVSTYPITSNLTATTTLEGGHKSTCYVASVGGTGIGSPSSSNGWLVATTPANFKRAFKISISGIKTDKNPIVKIGLPGTDDTAKLNAFQDGIDATEMKAIVDANKDNVAFKTYTLKVVSDADFDAAK